MTTKSRIRLIVLAPIAFAIFAAFIACSVVSAAINRLRHGKDYEAGGSIGFEEECP